MPSRTFRRVVRFDGNSKVQGRMSSKLSRTMGSCVARIEQTVEDCKGETNLVQRALYAISKNLNLTLCQWGSF